MKLLNKRHRKGSVFLLIVCMLVASVSITALAVIHQNAGTEMSFDANTGR